MKPVFLQHNLVSGYYKGVSHSSHIPTDCPTLFLFFVDIKAPSERARWVNIQRTAETCMLLLYGHLTHCWIVKISQLLQLTVLCINVLNCNNQQDNNQSSRSLYNQFYFILVHLPRSSCFPSSYQYVPWILLLLHIFSPKPPTPSNHTHVQFNQKHFFNN